ncbi:MAG: DMT family transporter [bacterium]|nr:DMT family transporter [bacterium]
MILSKAKKIFLAHIAIIIAILIWGSTYFVIKDSLNGIHPVTLVFYRFIIATGIMGVILTIKRINPFYGIHRGINLGMILWLLYIPQTIGLMYVSASSSGFLISLYIIIIPIITTIFMKNKITVQRIVSIIVALCGLYVVTGGISSIGFGDSITIVAAFAIAFQYLLVDYYLKQKADPLVICFQQFLFLTIWTFITVLLIGAPFTITGDTAFYQMLYLALFPSVVAYILQTHSQLYITPMTVAIFGVLEPISAAFFAWTLGGEKMMPMKAAGGFIIVLAILIAEIQIKKKRKNKKFKFS